MGFRFRPSKDPPFPHSPPPPPALPPSVYFANQAMRYSYDGFDGPMYPHSSIDALQRELEEERIREEIIARRIVQKRMVEEQIRREIEIERELMMMERFQVERYREPSRMIGGPDEIFGPAPIRRKVEFEERSPPFGGSAYLGSGENSGCDGTMIDEFSQVRFPNDKFSGVKRKSIATICSTSDVKFPKPLQKDWSCALCQVSTTSEEALNDHLKGKKHLAMVAQLSSDNKPAVAKKITSSSNCKSSSSMPKMSAPKNNCKNKAAKAKGKCKGKEKRKGKGIVSIEANGKTYEVVESGAHLWCSLCKIQCTGRGNMATHLAGKKHAREEEKEGEKLKEVVKMEAAEEVTKMHD